jgi:hypothetical protein
MEERGRAFWFSPLVINNAICNWLLKHLAKVRITGPITAQAMCPHSWGYANFPAVMHPVFIDAVRSGRLDAFRIPDQRMQLARFSINAFRLFGADQAALGDRFYPPEGDEEDWLSAALPLFAGRYGIIFGDLAVAHFSFYTQERDLLRTDILDDYYGLAGLPAPASRRPRRAIGEWLRDISGRQLRPPWRKQDPGPQYVISIEPGMSN